MAHNQNEVNSVQDSLKIALLGRGKMGGSVEHLALEVGHQITPLSEADVWIDFSHADCVLKHCQQAVAMQKPLVIGTTGWQDKLDQVKDIVAKGEIGMIYASNFALGMHLFSQIVAKAATLIDSVDLYDVAGWERHHHQKADAPSGTAKMLAEILLKCLKGKDILCYQTLNRAPQKNEIHFSSVRCGSITGEHTILFDSPEDSITLTHQAKNRTIFARGAIAAAHWIRDKRGIYQLEDMLHDRLSSSKQKR